MELNGHNIIWLLLHSLW